MYKRQEESSVSQEPGIKPFKMEGVFVNTNPDAGTEEINEAFDLETLEFSLIKEELKQYCVSNLGKRDVYKRQFMTSRRAPTSNNESTHSSRSSAVH